VLEINRLWGVGRFVISWAATGDTVVMVLIAAQGIMASGTAASRS
jgi:hypothetical protein